MGDGVEGFFPPVPGVFFAAMGVKAVASGVRFGGEGFDMAFGGVLSASLTTFLGLPRPRGE